MRQKTNATLGALAQGMGQRLLCDNHKQKVRKSLHAEYVSLEEPEAKQKGLL